MTKTLTIMALFLAVGACSGTQEAADLPLKAPAGTPGAAAVDTGNAFFRDGKWGQARAQYETALTIAPTLAEAHYDLALALDRLGKTI
jgi:Flp pilus assembly protein TadD